MSSKKVIIFFSIFFLSIFFLSYISCRNENRKDYQFVISKVKEGANGRISVANSNCEFDFANFNSYKIDIEKDDSLVKKAFSKKVNIYRKDTKTDQYKLVLTLEESGTFPIDWQ